MLSFKQCLVEKFQKAKIMPFVEFCLMSLLSQFYGSHHFSVFIIILLASAAVSGSILLVGLYLFRALPAGTFLPAFQVSRQVSWQFLSS